MCARGQQKILSSHSHQPYKPDDSKARVPVFFYSLSAPPMLLPSDCPIPYIFYP